MTQSIPSTKQAPYSPADVVRVAWRLVRRVVIMVIGVSVLLFGVILIFLPGPGLVVIAIGMSILASEFVWAAYLLRHMTRIVKENWERYFPPKQ